MQIRFSQLKDRFKHSLLRVFLVSGDEPYQHMVAADLYRKRLKDSGFVERKILTVESGFDWSELELAKNNMSLFGERTLIDLRIPNGKPGVNGSKAIVNFINHLHEDTMLLVQTPKLDRNAMNSAWVKAIDKNGAVLRVWPLNEIETKNWISHKLKSKGFSVTSDVVSYITQHVEGNLLAAMQEIEKLEILSETKKLDIQAINKLLTNSSHYSINELMDAIAKKDSSRLVRIMQGLKKEDIALPLVLWSLTEIIRKQLDTNDRRKKFTSRNNLEKLSLIHQQEIDVNNAFDNENLLKQCAFVDRNIKGRAQGNPWHELLQLGLAAQLMA